MFRRASIRFWIAFSILASGSCASATGGTGPAPTLASLSDDGPFQVASYTDFPDVPEFGDGTVYYPVDARAPVGGVAVAPGFTERQSHVAWWGPRLASHGFAVLVLDTNDPRNRPDARADALIAAVRTLERENTRPGSPLEARVDADRMAVMGHSMGGGGALLAANQLGDEIRAVIPFTPWEPDGGFDAISAPTLIIAGAEDGIAPVSDHAWPHYRSISGSVPKAYLEFEGGDHFIADTERGPDLATVGRYGIAWLKLYLDGDERYRPFIYGEVAAADRAKFSRYETSSPSVSSAAIGTMSELMVHVIYPASDAIFYIDTRTPTTTREWGELEAKALTLAESANLLMMPERARDDGRWMRDSRLLLDAGRAAFEAAKKRDVEGLSNLNDRLYRSCVTCHRNYRPGYGRR